MTVGFGVVVQDFPKGLKGERRAAQGRARSPRSRSRRGQTSRSARSPAGAVGALSKESSTGARRIRRTTFGNERAPSTGRSKGRYGLVSPPLRPTEAGRLSARRSHASARSAMRRCALLEATEGSDTLWAAVPPAAVSASARARSARRAGPSRSGGQAVDRAARAVEVNRSHRVPLSGDAPAIIETLPRLSGNRGRDFPVLDQPRSGRQWLFESEGAPRRRDARHCPEANPRPCCLASSCTTCGRR